MAKVIKNIGKEVRAYQLGAGSTVEQSLIAEGKIRVRNGNYELFSQESREKGEMAVTGDYFKVDNAGYPYPNKADWFELNHRHIDGDRFEQLPK